jgi:hypothetical protein
LYRAAEADHGHAAKTRWATLIEESALGQPALNAMSIIDLFQLGLAEAVGLRDLPVRLELLTLPPMIRPAMVVRLRSHLASSGRSQASPKRTSSVMPTIVGMKSPIAVRSGFGWVASAMVWSFRR